MAEDCFFRNFYSESLGIYITQPAYLNYFGENYLIIDHIRSLLRSQFKIYSRDIVGEIDQERITKTIMCRFLEISSQSEICVYNNYLKFFNSKKDFFLFEEKIRKHPEKFFYPSAKNNYYSIDTNWKFFIFMLCFFLWLDKNCTIKIRELIDSFMIRNIVFREDGNIISTYDKPLSLYLDKIKEIFEEYNIKEENVTISNNIFFREEMENLYALESNHIIKHFFGVLLPFYRRCGDFIENYEGVFITISDDNEYREQIKDIFQSCDDWKIVFEKNQQPSSYDGNILCILFGKTVDDYNQFSDYISMILNNKKDLFILDDVQFYRKIIKNFPIKII